MKKLIDASDIDTVVEERVSSENKHFDIYVDADVEEGIPSTLLIKPSNKLRLFKKLFCRKYQS